MNNNKIKYNMATFILLVLFLSTLHAQKPATIATKGNPNTYSFSKAKKLLYTKIYNTKSLRKTFYCSCSYSKKRVVDHKSCGYKIRKNAKRAKRTEAEHVVAAHAFGWSFKEWREGDNKKCGFKKNGKPLKGRKCAMKNPEFKRMHNDLYNLYPSVGEVNGNRSNYSMAMIPGEKRKYGSCDIEIEDRKVEPRPDIRGDIARTYFYMNDAYPGRGVISNKNRKLFEAWDKEDPASKEECERAAKIQKIQGNENVFVSRKCKEK